MQITMTGGTDAASPRLRLGAGRGERRDEALRPGLPMERELGLVVEMAHDLRSPLTSIISLAELLQSGQSGPVNETQRRQLGLIYSAALCLCATASDVIEVARQGDTLAERQARVFSIREIFANLRDLVRPMVEVRGLQLIFDSVEPDLRVGYPRALNRVLLNLTTNAVKYTDRGSVTVRAREAGGGRMEFSVEDTGAGIPVEDVDHLFEPFQPRNGAEHHFSSAGLGLAISHRLVKAMRSELAFEQGAERGTRFFFELDLPAAEATRDGRAG